MVLLTFLQFTGQLFTSCPYQCYMSASTSTLLD